MADIHDKADEVKAKLDEKLSDVKEVAGEVAGKVKGKLHDAKAKAKQHELFQKAVKKAFKSCDYDGSGKLDGAELYGGILLVWDKVNRLSPVHIKVPKQQEVKDIMKKHDIDASGQLTEEEFADVVEDLVAGSSDSWHKSIWARVAFAMALKLAIFPAAGYGLKKGLDSAGFTPINKVPTAVLAFACEIGYKVGNLAIGDVSDD